MIQHSFLDYPSNDTICVTAYLSGCDNSCDGCHNSQLKHHIRLDYDLLCNRIIKACERLDTKDVCLMGGDPLYKKNIDITNRFIQDHVSKYNVCVYTGYDIDHAQQVLTKGFKFLKTGCYDKGLSQESKKTDDIFVLSSTNQCLYDKDFNLLSKDGIYKFTKEVI